ncbi:MAG: CoA transferase subunit B [Chloroflexi bacterium]|nr:CoA transferase subunit B [Chloroflexota bacterium]
MTDAAIRDLIALRIAKELRDGYFVNLGIGLPTLVSNYIPDDIQVTFQAENGMLGYGRIADEAEAHFELINAGGQPVTLVPGACFFDSATSFAMIRGGHVDLTVLGALQVSERGDLANWLRPERGVGNIGGAMDLVSGARRVVIAMEHVTKSGQPKIVKECRYPLTGKGVVDLVVTDMAVVEVTPEGLVLREIAPGLSVEEVQRVTEPRLIVPPDLKEIEY